MQMLTLIASVSRVSLVDDSSSAGWPWWWLVGVAMAFMGAAAAWTYIRRDPWPPPAGSVERAYRVLAWRLRLRPGDRLALRRLSKRGGVPPVALLLSETAFEHAHQRALESGEVLCLPPRLKQRIFQRR